MLSPVLVGRDQELTRASAFLDELPHGTAALCFEGEPGIGKTAVWRATTEQATRRGYRLLACRPDQAEARLSFVGLSDLLKDVSGAVLHALPETQRHALALALLLETPRDGRAPDARALAMAFTSALNELARTAPLVVAVDDFQWLDPSSARLLAFAFRRLPTRTIGLLCTLRTPYVSSELTAIGRALGDRFDVLALGGLGRQAIRRIVAEVARTPQAQTSLTRIVDAAAGNPLFAIEMVSAIERAGNTRPAVGVPVADSLRELIAGRLRSTVPRARDALLAAAALSQPTVELPPDRFRCG